VDIKSLSELKGDAKLLAAAIAFAKKERNDENIMFFFDKGNAEAVYPKYISPSASTQVNLPAALTDAMKGLADKKDWKNSAWPKLLEASKKEIDKLWIRDCKKRFVVSDLYKQWEIATAPKKKADPAKAAKLLGIKDVAKLKKAMEASIEGNKATAVRLLAELAKEEQLKDKAEAIMKSLEKAGLV